MKTDKKTLRRQLADLRATRRDWLNGATIAQWQGMPWCSGPRSPYCQGTGCEGCMTVAYARDRAAEYTPEINRLAALLSPPQQVVSVQGALW